MNPVSKLMEMIRNFYEDYGVSFVIVASYFGSGSIFIATAAGARFGYSVLWMIPVAVAVGYIKLDMAGRLGIHSNTSLASFIGKKVGRVPAYILGAVLTTGCIAWGLELFAAMGMCVQIFSGGLVNWMWFIPVAGILVLVLGFQRYGVVEKVMTALLITIFVLYLALFVASNPSIAKIARGYMGRLPSGSLTFLVAFLGTKALWPNDFLESVFTERKNWSGEEGVNNMRKDLLIAKPLWGILLATLMVIGAAAVLHERLGVTGLETFIDVVDPLRIGIGVWAAVIFLACIFIAAYNSQIPILWTPAYLFLGARGRDNPDIDSRGFRTIYALIVAVSMTSPLFTIFFGLSPVDQIILFPAYNGAVALPITVTFLLWAVNDEEVMGEHRNSWLMNLLAVPVVIAVILAAIFGAPDLFRLLTGGGF